MAAPSDTYTPTQWRYLPSDSSIFSRDRANVGANGYGDRVSGFVATNGDFVSFIANGGTQVLAWGTGPDDFELTEQAIDPHFYADPATSNLGGFVIPEFDLFFYYGQDADDDVKLGVFEYTRPASTATWTHLAQQQIAGGVTIVYIAQPLWYYDAGNNAIKIVTFYVENAIERHCVTTFDLDTNTFTANVVNTVNNNPVAGTFTSGALVSPSRVEPGDPWQMFDDPTSSSTTFYLFIMDSNGDLAVWEITGDDAGGTSMTDLPMTGSPMIDWSVDKPLVSTKWAYTFGYDPVNQLYWMNINLYENAVYNQQIWTATTPNGTWTELFNWNDDRTQDFSGSAFSRYSSSFGHCVGGRLYCAAFERDASAEDQVVYYDIDLSDGTYTEDARTSFDSGAGTPNYMNGAATGTIAFFNPYRGDNGEAIVFVVQDMIFGNSTGNDHMVGYYYANAAFASGTSFYGWGIPMGIA